MKLDACLPSSILAFCSFSLVTISTPNSLLTYHTNLGLFSILSYSILSYSLSHILLSCNQTDASPALLWITSLLPVACGAISPDCLPHLNFVSLHLSPSIFTADCRSLMRISPLFHAPLSALRANMQWKRRKTFSLVNSAHFSSSLLGLLLLTRPLLETTFERRLVQLGLFHNTSLQRLLLLLLSSIADRERELN